MQHAFAFKNGEIKKALNFVIISSEVSQQNSLIQVIPFTITQNKEERYFSLGKYSTGNEP